MRNLTFNFGNEANIIACIEHDDQTITIPAVENSPVFQSMEELAQNYAQARGVKPENFKNWVLLEDNTCYTYVLRAGTAGIRASEIETVIAEAFEELRQEDGMSALGINSVMTLVHDSNDVEATLITLNTNYPHLSGIINALYEKLTAADCFVPVEGEVVEEDTRSTFEKFLDGEMTCRSTLAIVAHALHAATNATKDELLTTYNEIFGDSTQAFERFRITYDAVVATLRTYTVANVEQGLLVVTQEPIGIVDEAAKTNLIVVAGLASRTSVNVPVCRVGRTGVITSAEYLSVEEVAAQDMYNIGGQATIVRFDETVDAELAALTTEAGDNEDFDDQDFDNDFDGRDFDDEDSDYDRD